MEQNSNLSTAGGDSRRDFFKKAATATAAAVASANVFKTPVYGQNQAPSTGRAIGANDRITVGYVGIGGWPSNCPGMGLAHVQSQKNNAAENNIAQAAVCDLYSVRNDHSKELIGGADVKAYSDYRKLLERKDIDAIVISTHDTWHAKISIDSMEAGKHVYCEKPVTRYLPEVFDVHDTVKRTGKVYQAGSQGCSAAAWSRAAEWIKAGKIGKPVWAQGYYNRNNPKGEWNYSIINDAGPQNIDWQTWLGPVHNKIPFNADHFFRWRKFYPYCTGLLGDLVPHRLFPLMLATGNPEFPTRVVSVGTQAWNTDEHTPGALKRDVPEHVELIAEFPSGMTIVIASSTVNATSPGFVIYGHEATLSIGDQGNRIELVPERQFSEEIDPEAENGLTPHEDVGVHEKNWFDSIRSNKTPNASIDLAVRAQTVISLAEMSNRLKIACLFDEKTRKVTTGDGKEVAPLTYGSTDRS
ncbi:MAG: Gfo/Idh/MocA family oxidoreductase [Verrucomicrobia bacterium]|nr:Gfo/Idh/MocA family oxidoreductase [Verrucomicrobiota bacterium]